jgi:D-lactate dehydrogenase
MLGFKKGSYLINTARGGLVETEAIVLGLDRGILEGVGLDVLEEEKDLNEEAAILTTHFKETVNLKNLLYDHILINHPKVLITPHNAFNSKEALDRITSTTIQNVKDYLDKTPLKNLI